MRVIQQLAVALALGATSEEVVMAQDSPLVPGTQVRVAVPEGFRVARGLQGFVHVPSGSLIALQQMPVSIADYLKTIESMPDQDVRSRESLPMGEFPGALVGYDTEDHSGEQLVILDRVFGEGEVSWLLRGVAPRGDQALSGVVEACLRECVWDREVKVPNFDLRWAPIYTYPLQLTFESRSSQTYTVNGAGGDGVSGLPVLTLEWRDVGEIEGDELDAETAMAEDLGLDVTIERAVESTYYGQPAITLLARGQVIGSDQRLAIRYLWVPMTEGLLIVAGTCAEADELEWMPRFETIFSSVRRVTTNFVGFRNSTFLGQPMVGLEQMANEQILEILGRSKSRVEPVELWWFLRHRGEAVPDELMDTVAWASMEMQVGDNTVMVRGHLDGSAAQVDSNGLGAMYEGADRGNRTHQDMYISAITFAVQAGHLLEHFEDVPQVPDLPDRDTIRFSVATPTGVRAVEVAAAELEAGQGPLAPLFGSAAMLMRSIRHHQPRLAVQNARERAPEYMNCLLTVLSETDGESVTLASDRPLVDPLALGPEGGLRTWAQRFSFDFDALATGPILDALEDAASFGVGSRDVGTIHAMVDWQQSGQVTPATFRVERTTDEDGQKAVVIRKVEQR